MGWWSTRPWLFPLDPLWEPLWFRLLQCSMIPQQLWVTLSHSLRFVFFLGFFCFVFLLLFGCWENVGFYGFLWYTSILVCIFRFSRIFIMWDLNFFKENDLKDSDCSFFMSHQRMWYMVQPNVLVFITFPTWLLKKFYLKKKKICNFGCYSSIFWDDFNSQWIWKTLKKASIGRFVNLFWGCFKGFIHEN